MVDYTRVMAAYAQASAEQRTEEYYSTASPHVLSWFNPNDTTPGNWNGTHVEGNKSLDYSDFLYQQIVANNIAVAALTLYIWEFITTLYDEVQLYRHRKLSSPHVILFALIRYGTLPALILPTYSTWHNFQNDPDGCLQHQQLAIAAVQLIVGMVFAWRTIAIWGKDRRIVALLGFLVVAQFAASFALLWFSEEKRLPNGACMPVPSPSGFNPLPWFYLTAMAYDAVTIGLSTWKLWQFSALGRPLELQPRTIDAFRAPIKTAKKVRDQWASFSPLLEKLMGSGLVYFTIATAFNACNFALEIKQDLHAKSLVALYAPLMCILCQRIILLDVKALYGSSHDSGSRERSLVERVMRDHRKSWEGDDLPANRPFASSTLRPSSERPLAPTSPSSSPSEKETEHTAVAIDEPVDPSAVTFEGMLAHPPAAADHQRKPQLHWWSRKRDSASSREDASSHLPSSTQHRAASSTSSSSSRPPVEMTGEQKALALRMAGLDDGSQAQPS